MSKLQWAKFFWSDWEADEGLKQCSLAAQGAWMRMLCICAKGEPYGYLAIGGRSLDVEGIARAIGRPETEATAYVAELEQWGVFSRDKTGRIYSRRMVRDAERSNKARKNGLQGGRPPTPDNQTPNLNESKPLASSLLLLEFEEWWKDYPHKIGKADAKKSYFRARQNGVSQETLTGGVRRYVAAKPKDRPWCNPATFINQERWLDQPAGAVIELPPEQLEMARRRAWTRALEDERKNGAWSARFPKSDIPPEFISDLAKGMTP